MDEVDWMWMKPGSSFGEWKESERWRRKRDFFTNFANPVFNQHLSWERSTPEILGRIICWITREILYEHLKAYPRGKLCKFHQDQWTRNLLKDFSSNFKFWISSFPGRLALVYSILHIDSVKSHVCGVINKKDGLKDGWRENSVEQCIRWEGQMR